MFSSGSNKVDRCYFRRYLKPCLQQIGWPRKGKYDFLNAIIFKKVQFYSGFRLFVANSVDFKVQCNELCPSFKPIYILPIIGDSVKVDFMCVSCEYG